MIKVKITHIISKMVTDRANITIAIKHEVDYGLSNGVGFLFKFDLVLL